MLMEPYVSQLALEMTKAIESGLLDGSDSPAVIEHQPETFPELEPVS
jgi:hypothetical protein